MIKPEHIPDEVVEAAAKNMDWTSAIALPQDKLRFKGHIAAALNAWPDAFITKYSEGAPAFNLPLTQEKSNGSG